MVKKTSEENTSQSKTPIVPILLGLVAGGILGKLLILFFKIVGIL